MKNIHAKLGTETRTEIVSRRLRAPLRREDRKALETAHPRTRRLTTGRGRDLRASTNGRPGCGFRQTAPHGNGPGEHLSGVFGGAPGAGRRCAGNFPTFAGTVPRAPRNSSRRFTGPRVAPAGDFPACAGNFPARVRTTVPACAANLAAPAAVSRARRTFLPDRSATTHAQTHHG